MTVHCPLDCEYLIEARKHEKFDEVPEDSVPHRDVPVSQEFLEQHDHLLGLLSQMVLGAALTTPSAIDADVREALDALIRTYRTRQSGLIYETRPTNPVAGQVQQRITANIEELQQELTRRNGMTTLRDAEILGVLIFLHRIALHWDNKRPRGRSFVSFLLERHGEMQQQVAEEEPAAPPSSLILP